MLSFPLGLAVTQVIDTTQIGQLLVAEVFIVFQGPANFQPVFDGDIQRHDTGLG